MKASFLKSKIRSLRKFDLIKVIIDILLPDLAGIGDYNPNMFYRKGDKVYYYDEKSQRSKILEATEDISAGEPLSLAKWSIVGGTGLPNVEILKKLELNTNNNLTYNGSILNNVHVSKEQPVMNELDIWFSLDVSESDGGDSPVQRNSEVVIKNMVVQDSEPEDNVYLWGDISLPTEKDE